MIQHALESAKVGKHNDANNRTIFETSKNSPLWQESHLAPIRRNISVHHTTRMQFIRDKSVGK